MMMMMMLYSWLLAHTFISHKRFPWDSHYWCTLASNRFRVMPSAEKKNKTLQNNHWPSIHTCYMTMTQTGDIDYYSMKNVISKKLFVTHWTFTLKSQSVNWLRKLFGGIVCSYTRSGIVIYTTDKDVLSQLKKTMFPVMCLALSVNCSWKGFTHPR